jgi:hypothetical protein
MERPKHRDGAREYLCGVFRVSQPADSNGIAGWIVAGVALLGVAWASAVRILSYVTRSEMARRFEAQDQKFLEVVAAMKTEFERSLEQHRLERLRIADEQKAMHVENQAIDKEIFGQLREQDKAIARIEGSLSRMPHSGPSEG